MPLSGLGERMVCPRCGYRRVNLIFEPPAAAKRAPA
jgi:DNA-directed RNA polymerase subunit RPC12/RpoP